MVTRTGRSAETQLPVTGLPGPKPAPGSRHRSGKWPLRETVSAFLGVLASRLWSTGRGPFASSHRPGEGPPSAAPPAHAAGRASPVPQVTAASASRGLRSPPGPSQPSPPAPRTSPRLPAPRLPPGPASEPLPSCSLLPEPVPYALLARPPSRRPVAKTTCRPASPGRGSLPCGAPVSSLCPQDRGVLCRSLTRLMVSHTLEHSTRGEPGPLGPGARAAGLCAEQGAVPSGTRRQSVAVDLCVAVTKAP